MTETKDATGAKPKKKREQGQKTIRAILSKINRRLADTTLDKAEWLSLVKDAVQLAKTLGMARNANKPQSSGVSRGESNLF